MNNPANELAAIKASAESTPIAAATAIQAASSMTGSASRAISKYFATFIGVSWWRGEVGDRGPIV
jgi:hypothetical protein